MSDKSEPEIYALDEAEESAKKIFMNPKRGYWGKNKMIKKYNK